MLLLMSKGISTIQDRSIRTLGNRNREKNDYLTTYPSSSSASCPRSFSFAFFIEWKNNINLYVTSYSRTEKPTSYYDAAVAAYTSS